MLAFGFEFTDKMTSARNQEPAFQPSNLPSLPRTSALLAHPRSRARGNGTRGLCGGTLQEAQPAKGVFLCHGAAQVCAQARRDSKGRETFSPGQGSFPFPVLHFCPYAFTFYLGSIDDPVSSRNQLLGEDVSPETARQLLRHCVKGG